MPGKLSEALKKNFEKHFVTFEGLSGSFTNEEEVKNAKKVLDPIISADTKSKDDNFKNVREAYKSLADLYAEADDNLYPNGISSEIENRLGIAKEAIDKYLSGKEYSTNPEYRSVLRLRNELAGLKSESEAIIAMDENLLKSQEIIENNNKGELGRNMQLDKFWEPFFKKYPVNLPLSRKDSEAFENKESKTLRALEDGRAQTEGKKKYLDTVLARYDQIIDIEKKLYSMGEKLSEMEHFGYEYPKEVLDKLEEMKEEEQIDFLNGVVKKFEDDIQEIDKLEKQTEDFAKERKTFRNFWEKVKKDENYLNSKEGDAEYKRIQDYYEDKIRKTKGAEKDYYAQNVGIFTQYLTKITSNAKDLYQKKIDDTNAEINRIQNIRSNKLNEITEIKEKFFDNVNEQKKLRGTYGNLQILQTELKNKLIEEGFGDRTREDNLKESNRVIKNTRDSIKQKIDGKLEFMRHYLDGIDEYKGIKIELKNGIENIKDMDVDYKSKVAKIYADEGRDRICNWSARLKAVKSRTFRSNSTEFQNMYDLVDSIEKKLFNPYDHEGYVDSDEYVEDMKKLNEAAKAYSIAKGKASRSTTQGQERLDIAHEIMGNNTRIESITEELKHYSISSEKKEELLNDMNKALKETEEKFHSFCQKCNKTLGIKKLEKEGKILSDNELESFSIDPPSMEELDNYAKEEINRQKRFDMIEASEEKKQEIKNSLQETYKKYDTSIRYEVETLKKDSLFLSFMEMKKEKSVGKALSMEMTEQDKEKLMNSQIKKLDKKLTECVNRPDKEKVSIDELGGVQKGKGSQNNKSKGNLSMTGPSKRDDGLSKK